MPVTALGVERVRSRGVAAHSGGSVLEGGALAETMTIPEPILDLPVAAAGVLLAVLLPVVRGDGAY